jgi:hypothetical protein
VATVADDSAKFAMELDTTRLDTICATRRASEQTRINAAVSSTHILDSGEGRGQLPYVLRVRGNDPGLLLN